MWYFPVLHCSTMKLVGFVKSPYPSLFEPQRKVINFPVQLEVVDTYMRKDPNLWCM